MPVRDNREDDDNVLYVRPPSATEMTPEEFNPQPFQAASGQWFKPINYSELQGEVSANPDEYQDPYTQDIFSRYGYDLRPRLTDGRAAIPYNDYMRFYHEMTAHPDTGGGILNAAPGLQILALPFAAAAAPGISAGLGGGLTGAMGTGALFGAARSALSDGSPEDMLRGAAIGGAGGAAVYGAGQLMDTAPAWSDIENPGNVGNEMYQGAQSYPYTYHDPQVYDTLPETGQYEVSTTPTTPPDGTQYTVQDAYGAPAELPALDGPGVTALPDTLPDVPHGVPELSAPGPLSNLTGWMKANPGLAALGGLGTMAVLGGVGGKPTTTTVGGPGPTTRTPNTIPGTYTPGAVFNPNVFVPSAQRQAENPTTQLPSYGPVEVPLAQAVQYQLPTAQQYGVTPTTPRFSAGQVSPLTMLRR